MAAVLLLGAPASISKVVCVSPEGHSEVEDWGSACCAGLPEPCGAGFAAPSLCQGCTDYALTPTADTNNAQPQPAGSSLLPANARIDSGATVASAGGSGDRPQVEPDTPALMTSLRC